MSIKQSTYQRFFLLGRMTLVFTGLALAVYAVLLGIGNFNKGKHAFNLFFAGVFLINFILCLSYYLLAQFKFKKLLNAKEILTAHLLMIINLITGILSIVFLINQL